MWRLLAVSKLDFAYDARSKHKQNGEVLKLSEHFVFNFDNLDLFDLGYKLEYFIKLINAIAYDCRPDHVRNFINAFIISFFNFLRDPCQVDL